MKTQSKNHDFLHSHPMLEKKLKLDENHVIIDKEDWMEVKPRYPGPIKGIHLGSGNFGQAIQALKDGEKVFRSGWNSKGSYIALQRAYPVNGHLNTSNADGSHPHDTAKIEGNPKNKIGQILPHILFKTPGGSEIYGDMHYSDYASWSASQTDMLAEDWGIVE